MTRYHFNISCGINLPDEEGVELADTQTVRRQALLSAGEMLRDAGRGGPFGRDWNMIVTDDMGLVLFRLDFQIIESAALKRG